MNEFFIASVEISDRHTDTTMIETTIRGEQYSEIKGRSQEHITITIQLDGSGDTSVITNKYIINEITKRLGVIELNTIKQKQNHMENTKEVLMLEETIRVLRVENKHLKIVSENAIANAKNVEILSNKLDILEHRYSNLEQRYKESKKGIKALYKNIFNK